MERKDPYLTFSFLVEIEGVTVAGFSEVSGIQLEVETEEYHEGGINDFAHHLTKTARYPNLSLKRGLVDSSVLWEWQSEVSQGRVQTRNIHIVLLDEARDEKWRWRCLQAYPVKWIGPDFRASDANASIESLELVHKGLEKY